MNILKILKNVPKGTKLYSPIFGDISFVGIRDGRIMFLFDGIVDLFYSDGKYTEKGECMLFPSRENRDWSAFTLNKFDIKSLKPFNKVLVRDHDIDLWKCDFYSHYIKNTHYAYRGIFNQYHQCVPYNDETKHLVGTDKDCPEYYKTW